MPPANRAKPEFSPFGRYLIDVQNRKDVSTPNHYHDIEHIKDECRLDLVPAGSQSRFNNLEWAAQRGYVPCPQCKTS